MNILDYLDSSYSNKFKIFTLLKTVPALNKVGKLQIEPKVQKIAEEISENLKFDEYQAILTESLTKVYYKKNWEYKIAKYSYVTALRKQGKAVEVVTANILPIFTKKDKRYYLFQKRSESSGLYPSYYSIFGGSFSPETDKDNIYTTALREIKEEILGVISSDDEILKKLKESKKLLTQETDNGNLQINFLGIEININKDAKGEESEGDLIKVDAKNIEHFIKDNIDKITPLALTALHYHLN